jgi:arylsulfatase A-like enzyme
VDFSSNLPEAKSLRQAGVALLRSRPEPETTIKADVFARADQIAGEFLDWQAGLSGRPFFAFLNFFDAHDPYRPRGEFLHRFTGGSEIVDRYDSAIAWMDHVVGRTLQSLQERGLLDNTIVVVTADHGEGLGEHGRMGHGNSLYSELLHVPLLIRYPAAVPVGRRVGTSISLRDIAATVLDLTGIVDQQISGHSLRDTWDSAVELTRREIAAELDTGLNVDAFDRHAKYSLTSRLDGRFHYIVDNIGRTEELYDYRADPDETNNLASRLDMQKDLLRFRVQLNRR